MWRHLWTGWRRIEMPLILSAADFFREMGDDTETIERGQAFDEFWMGPLIRDRVAGLDAAILPSEDARGGVHERVRRIAMAAWFQAQA